MSMLAAVRANNVERVKLLRSRGKGWRTEKHQRELWRTAVELGHLEMLKCLHTLHCKRSDDSCEWAIEHGHGRRLVEWLRGIGERYTGYEATKAVEQGDLPLLEWLREDVDSDCVWWDARETYLTAVKVGRLDIVRYLEDHGCLERASMRGFDGEEGRRQRRQFRCNALVCAASNGHLEVLLHLREQPLLQHPLRASDELHMMGAAVRGGQLEVVAFLHEEGFPWGGERPYPGMLFLDSDERNAVPSMSPSERMRWYECARYVLAYGCVDSSGELRVHMLEDRARLLRDIVRQCLLPKWRSTVAWMVKVRPYAWHWLEEHAKIQCAEGGAGRKRDLEVIGEACTAIMEVV